jgi:hypothetical protein
MILSMVNEDDLSNFSDDIADYEDFYEKASQTIVLWR